MAEGDFATEYFTQFACGMPARKTFDSRVDFFTVLAAYLVVDVASVQRHVWAPDCLGQNLPEILIRAGYGNPPILGPEQAKGAILGMMNLTVMFEDTLAYRVEVSTKDMQRILVHAQSLQQVI